MVYAFDLLDGTKLWEFNLFAPGTNQTPQLGQVLRDRDGNLVLVYQDGWTLKLDYIFADLGTLRQSFSTGLAPVSGTTVATPATGSTTFTSSVHVEEHLIRVGLNYKF